MNIQRIIKPFQSNLNNSTFHNQIRSINLFHSNRNPNPKFFKSYRILFSTPNPPIHRTIYQPTVPVNRTLRTQAQPPPSDSNPSSSFSNPPSSHSSKKKLDKNIISLSLFICTGIGLWIYFKNEKLKVEERKKEESKNKSIGKVRVGGEFDLIDVHTNRKFNQDDLLGKFSLIYFGFTNCPDICPEELDKMCEVVNRINKDGFEVPIQPIFVSVDPNRDTPEAIVSYLKDFHSSMIGLTGSYEAIKKMCKVYRVYFSTPPNLKPTDDYLVDHSIFFYLMAPNGNFVDAFGKIFSKDEVYVEVNRYMNEWSNGKRFGEEED